MIDVIFLVTAVNSKVDMELSHFACFLYHLFVDTHH